MKRRHRTLAAGLLVLAAALPGTVVGEPGFGIRISAVANLVYQLDCLSGYRRCTRDAYEALWRRTGWSDADEERLGHWRELQERYRLYADFEARAPDTPYPYTFPYLQARGVDVGEKIRLASLQADDAADYAERLRLLVQPRDARAAAEIIAHFQPRFAVWWDDGPATDLGRLAAGYQGVAERAGIGSLLTEVAVLFGVRTEQTSDLQVSLIALPEAARASRATVIENHAIVESRRGESPADRLGVIVHEFVHFLYAQSPERLHRELLAAFLASEYPWSLRAYNLINESIASAIGNGILERRLQSDSEYRRYAELPDSFYADYYVDKLAKALVPVVERHIAAGRPLAARFAADYLDTAAEALGPRLDDLALQLVSSAVVATDPALADLARRPASTLRTFSLFTHVTDSPGLAGTALARYPELSGIVLVPADDLGQLTGLIDEDLIALLEALVGRTGAFVYGAPRSSRATVYVVCGQDTDAVGRALDHLLTRSASFTGPSLPAGYPPAASSERISKRMPIARSRASSASPIASAGVSTP